MHDSPILAPVVALLIWKQMAWLTGIPILSRVINARPPLTREEIHAHTDRLPWNAKQEPLDFYLVCIVMALTDAARAADCWLAWIFAVCWMTQTLSGPVTKSKVTFGARLLASLPLIALTLHAGFQISHDLLAAYR